MSGPRVSSRRSIQTFQYARPPFSSGARTVVDLCDGDNLRGEVQVVRSGSGSGNRHNPAADELWFVLRGQARVIGPGGTLVGEFAAGDGLLIPRATRCRFVNVGAEDLELLLVSGFNRGKRTVEKRTESEETGGDEVERLSGRVL